MALAGGFVQGELNSNKSLLFKTKETEFISRKVGRKYEIL